jgi:hypothetical protein
MEDDELRKQDSLMHIPAIDRMHIASLVSILDLETTPSSTAKATASLPSVTVTALPSLSSVKRWQSSRVSNEQLDDRNARRSLPPLLSPRQTNQDASHYDSDTPLAPTSKSPSKRSGSLSARHTTTTTTTTTMTDGANEVSDGEDPHRPLSSRSQGESRAPSTRMDAGKRELARARLLKLRQQTLENSVLPSIQHQVRHTDSSRH